MPMPNWWAVRVRNPGEFIRLRNKTISNGIQIVHGPLKNPPKKKNGKGRASGSHVQAYRFNVRRFKERSQVTKWLKDNNVKYKSIEEPDWKKYRAQQKKNEIYRDPYKTLRTAILDKIASNRLQFKPIHDRRRR